MYEIGEEEIEAVARVIRSRQLLRYRGGEQGECTQLEKELCAKFGCQYALVVNSGTNALICALVACDIGPEDEVIIPAYTFMATAMAVLAVGAVPIIAEIDETLTLNAEDVESHISSRTKAIIPVHMHGLPSAMDKFMALADKYHLRIIEDACQSVGGAYRGQPLGVIGDIGAFSFNQFKTITAGEGGAIVTNDREMYEKALIQHDGGCLFRQHARRLSVPIFAGANYRVSEITGAILRVQLSRLDGLLRKLRERKRAAVEALQGSSACDPAPVHCVQGDCAQVVMLQVDTEARMRRLLRKLLAQGIMAGTPIDDSTGHVYTHWQPVLQQQAAHHPGLNAYHLTDTKYEYSREMCPRTLDVLSRSIGIAIDINESVDQTSCRAQRIRRLAESL
jgi:dTDP-4-amino-4,6-dideoxygalactose transaminase